MINPKTIILITAVIAIIGAIFYLQSKKLPVPTSENLKEAEIDIGSIVTERNKEILPSGGAGISTPGEVKSLFIKRIEEKAKQYEPAKEVTTPDGFINVPKISIKELIGKKVILVDFWTYSCINCQRTLPYLNAWDEKYSDKGLAIIGVHTPEFEFEKKYENVQAAVEKFGVKYPVVLDNDFSTWHAYKNRYWPRKYLIDIDGFIVYDHIGEGRYEETERKIQELLEERMTVLEIKDSIEKEIAKPEGVETVDALSPRSPEIYFGAWRNLYLGNGKSSTEGIQTLTKPIGIKTNILYLDGDWEFTREFAENKSAGAKIIFRYQAQKVFIVASSEEGVNIRILRDGVPVGDAAGIDIQTKNGETTVFVKEDGLYRLIEDPAGSGEHTLEIIIENPGLRAFTFTFG
ncbi:MAG: redoxin family protein [Patescibacteria group bacterium]|nr:redoxin family protein [Patescibacteria group bacterium]